MSLYQYDLQLLEWINHNRIKFLDQFFIFITDTAFLAAALIVIIVLLYGIAKKNAVLKVKGWQLVIALVTNSVIVNIIKYAVNRERPFIHNQLIEKLSTGGSPSFPSGHTSDAFMIAFSVSLLFARQKCWLLLIWVWALLVAYSRIVLGVHYPSDVLGSILIGMLIAFIVNYYFKKKKANGDAAMVERN